MELALLDTLNAERAARRAAIVVTYMESGQQRLVKGADIATDPLAVPLAEALRTGRSAMVAMAGARVFLTVHVPAPRLVITGAVHISQLLAPMAAMTGLDMVIIDPRTAFATPERFPGVDLRAQWPDEVLPSLGFDAFTAFAALTHDAKIDDSALVEALACGCFYVGALGSRKTNAARLERLTARGVPPDALARIHAPIGLDIGAANPAEIAVSILAQVIGTLRQRRVVRETAA